MDFYGPYAWHLPGLSVELSMLAFAMALGLVQLLLAGRLNNGQRGGRWNLGPRDGEPPPVSNIAARTERARVNFMETFPFFASAVLALSILSRHNSWTVYGSEAYVAARILYLPLYMFGVFGLRTLVWLIGTIGLAAMIAAMFFPM
jgi:uncharacterized MAPEG superfamily protein